MFLLSWKKTLLTHFLGFWSSKTCLLEFKCLFILKFIFIFKPQDFATPKMCFLDMVHGSPTPDNRPFSSVNLIIDNFLCSFSRYFTNFSTNTFDVTNDIMYWSQCILCITLSSGNSKSLYQLGTTVGIASNFSLYAFFSENAIIWFVLQNICILFRINICTHLVKFISIY